ncbi:small basic family protein [Brevibacillus sp. SYP-B805]|jgi:small basic protein|uniref:small basic family protein n=1 Tax=Brevibacillus sp. SYP-B805 TaxID=1578199 RepID=UPI0013EDD09F|nr:small basic family protein [Brevibacillus sp. SYP-B805]NGQ93724.1 small basic family protein [Brevibacillus sp. SYP-B805]
MWLPLIGLALGIAVGLLLDWRVPQEYSSYLSIALLAGLDTIFGGIRSYLERTFNVRIFMSGFFFNTLFAAGLAFLGAFLGIDLYLAAIVAFGVRLFNNLAVIRRIILSKWINQG